MISNMTTFALDVDGTYTADPVLWDMFIESARRRGHEIVVVTYRYPHEDCEAIRRLAAQNLQIVFTGRKAKQRSVQELGIGIHVWIDDMPWCLLHDASEYNAKNNITHP